MDWSRIPGRRGDRQKWAKTPQGRVVARENVLRLVLALDGIIIQDYIQVASILWAGISDIAWGIFSSTQRTEIADEFVHIDPFLCLILPDIRTDLTYLMRAVADRILCVNKRQSIIQVSFTIMRKDTNLLVIQMIYNVH